MAQHRCPATNLRSRAMAPRFVAKQLSRPTGLGGKVIQFLMNRGNASLNRLAVEQLDVQPSDRVLEIGFGGGVALPLLLSRARYVCGIDRSEDVVASARRHFSGWVEGDAADFQVGSVEKLPLASESFDRVLTVNTIYFWTSLAKGLEEIWRIMTPAGRVAIGFVPKARMERMNMPADIFSPRSPEDVTEALREASFSDVEIHAPHGPERAMVATAVKSSSSRKHRGEAE